MKAPVAITLVVLVLLLLGGGAYYYAAQSNDSANTAYSDVNASSDIANVNYAATNASASGTNTTVVNNANAVTNTSTVDTYAGWKTYTDDKYGFSLKYPSSWKFEIRNQTPAIGAADRIVTFLGTVELNGRQAATNPSVALHVNSKFNEADAAAWAKSHPILIKGTPATYANYTVAGVLGLRATYQEYGLDGIYSGNGESVAFQKGNKMYWIYTHNDKTLPETDIENIIQSITFAN